MPEARLRLLAPILLGFIICSLAFNLTVPVFEAPDEPSHVAMTRYLALHHALPNQQPSAGFPVGQEGSQPPLYYALGAALFALSPSPVLSPSFAQRNPFVGFDRSGPPWRNRNLYAHGVQESFPFRGDILGIHLVRLLSMLLGCVTITFTFLIAREIVPRRPVVAVLAAALVAFDPQFTFLSGAVNNDNAIAATATLTLWCLVRWARRGGSPRLAVLLGLALGAALLSKTDGILLIPLTVIVLLADLLFRGKPRLVAIRALIVGILTVGLAGWWFARNQILYGDPLGWSAMLAANGTMIRARPVSVGAAVAALWNARGTFWGIFGWTNIRYPAVVYHVADLLAAVAVVGLAIGAVLAARELPRLIGPVGPAPLPRRVWCALARSHDRLLPLALVVVWPPMVFVSLVRWVQINTAADQWRLLFAAIGAIGVLLTLGLGELGARFPLPLPPLPQGERGLRARDRALHSWADRNAPAGETGHKDPRKPPLPRLGEGVGGEGICPCDKKLSILQESALPLALTILGLAINLVVVFAVIVPAFYPTVVAAQSGSGAGATQRCARLDPLARIVPAIPNLLSGRCAVTVVDNQVIRFGSAIELIGERVGPSAPRPGEPLTVDLDWRATRPVPRDWSVSLRVVGDADATLAKVQGWPEAGRAPTSTWQVGTVYRDRYVLTPRWNGADPQLAQIWLNLYDASVPGGPSLPVTDQQGKALGDGVAIGTVKLAQTEQPPPAQTTVDAHFGSEIELSGYDASVKGDQLRLTLHWKDLGTIAEPYTVFVHIAEANGKVLAQSDSPPRGGAYPTTAWAVGETIRDARAIDLKGVPPGTYQVVVGLYRHATGARLPVRPEAGASAPHDALRLFNLTVGANGAAALGRN